MDTTLTLEEKNEWIAVFFEKIVNDFQIDNSDAEMKKYKVQLQHITFETYMSDDELRKSIAFAIDIIEELKMINKNGMTKEKFEIICNEKDERILSLLNIVKKHLCSQTINEIKDELYKIRRVGGAYAMLLSGPFLDQAIYSVYVHAVDNWEDENIYGSCIYFMIRAIMHMNCDEVTE